MPLLAFSMVCSSRSIKRGGLSPQTSSRAVGLQAEHAAEAIEQPEGVLLKRVGQRSSMIKADGLWVHLGIAEPGANWECILKACTESGLTLFSKLSPVDIFLYDCPRCRFRAKPSALRASLRCCALQEVPVLYSLVIS
jgi:hypothetical protein